MSLSLTLAEVYTDYAENDGFLYVTYASQEVFGWNIDYWNSEYRYYSHKSVWERMILTWDFLLHLRVMLIKDWH